MGWDVPGGQAQDREGTSPLLPLVFQPLLWKRKHVDKTHLWWLGENTPLFELDIMGLYKNWINCSPINIFRRFQPFVMFVVNHVVRDWQLDLIVKLNYRWQTTSMQSIFLVQSCVIIKCRTHTVTYIPTPATQHRLHDWYIYYRLIDRLLIDRLLMLLPDERHTFLRVSVHEC